MPSMPREPEAFAEAVQTMLKRMRPELDVQLIGPREMLVDGRRLDLENLFRLVAHDPDQGAEIVEQYLDHLFATDSVNALSMPIELARSRIMPRIQPETIFERLSRDMVAHVPFVNDTVILFVIDLPHMTVSITTEQMLRWNLTADDLDRIARENLEDYSPKVRMQFVDSQEGGRAVILAQQDGYDAARLLLGGLYGELAPKLGGDFLVATPARDMFVALSHNPEPFVERLHTRVLQDYQRLPYPITSRFFYVTRDGVAGTIAA
ncbi:MAG: DUF1444 family protein [Phycisphaerales bacterium]|nr:MAG: DUF1444 family protein [Phycisphaerales bacterium]